MPFFPLPTAAVSRSMSKHSTETDAELDARYEAYFSRTDIDGWETRKVSIYRGNLRK